MAQYLIHKAASRGISNIGWLESYHTFSFSHYYDPARIHFGALRVLNDDTVAPGMGFGKHPHQNMEIISIPLEGNLEHKDSMGNTTVIKAGEVQIMSAGTGVAHSEYNASNSDPVKFLQIWVFPEVNDLTPSYDQQKIDTTLMQNQWATIVSPEGKDGGLSIHQKAWFSLSNLQENSSLDYQFHKEENGLYVFLLEGNILANEVELERRDGLGITETTSIKFLAKANSRILLMEVPL